ncbi:MAG: VWA domain-containing protein [Caldilineaceae bacterium]|nr:VWA domain-containing protein [Caldilineaceae bacterium]
MICTPTPDPASHPSTPLATHISVILDRSGSMETIRDDVIGGFNAFLARQQHEPSQATLSLVQFDSQDPYEVLLHFVPLSDMPPLSSKRYVPRASPPRWLPCLSRSGLSRWWSWS